MEDTTKEKIKSEAFRRVTFCGKTSGLKCKLDVFLETANGHHERPIWHVADPAKFSLHYSTSIGSNQDRIKTG